MELADKTIVVYGLAGRTESAYGAADTPSTASHGIQLAALPVLTPAFAYDGERAPPPGTYGRSQTGPPSGKTVSGTITVDGKGAGATYTTSVLVPSIHELILASGFDATLGSGAYTFTPTPGPTGFDSLSMIAYSRGEQWPISGAYCDMNMVFEDAKPVMFEFPFAGLLGSESDVAVPSITYDATGVLAPNADGLAFSINSVTDLVVRSGRFELGASIDNARVDLNASGGHAGFTRGRRDPRLRVTVENPDTSQFNWKSIRDAGTTFAASIQFGTSALNRWTLTLAQCTLRAELNDDEPHSLVDLEIIPHCSTPIANDDVSLVYN